ncbi:hypothetical protein BC940DRAFT_79349 [Gongronella butleri]|nr:hypothetical protein BC940DRAFT_79349 [Gongronella butleri]
MQPVVHSTLGHQGIVRACRIKKEKKRKREHRRIDTTITILLPFSKMLPGTLPMTTISSALRIVERRCAITSTVRPSISLSSASCTNFSECAIQFYGKKKKKE